jgi:hypothetical protein
VVLGAALALGLAVRLPGVFWGVNFPFGWYGHHVDEYTHLLNAQVLINPQLAPEWVPNTYPKGLAAHVAAILMPVRAMRGELLAALPSDQAIITTGRLIAVLYGTATIVVVYLLARGLFRDRRVAEASAFILALGGLHVTQSHFFVADAPTVFWHCLACYAMWRALRAPAADDSLLLAAAAFCVGVAIGLKFMVVALPSVLLVALLRPPRLTRVLQAAAFGLAGFVIVNADSYSLFEIAKTFVKSGGHVRAFSRSRGALMYAVQLPALLSAPVVLLMIGGAALAIRRWRRGQLPPIGTAWWIAIVLPNVLAAAFVLFGPNNFPRHLLPFVPWACMAAGYALVNVSDRACALGVSRALPVVALFLYMGAFVYDGERVFLQDPRNRAARWLQEHVPAGTEIWWQGHEGIREYRHVAFPRGRPPLLVLELHRASYLNGMGWKDSMPSDPAQVHGVETERDLIALQALFRHASEYREVARFSEGYVMPEFRLTDRLIGNRARNYVAEIVVFRR